MEETNSESLQLSYLRPPPTSQSHPWLIFCHGKQKQRQTFYSISENRYYVKIIREMRNKIACSSEDGWLLLKDSKSQDHSLVNLRSMENIQLPKTSLNVKLYIPLTYPAENDNGCIFFICENNVVLIWNNGESEFKEFHMELEDGDVIKDAIVCGECMYGLTWQKKLIETKNYLVMPIKFENSAIRETIKSKRHPQLLSRYWMVASGSELLVLIQTYSNTLCNYTRMVDFEIFRAEFIKGTWEEVKDIGNRTIFLSWNPTYSYSFIINDGGENRIWRNSIYFSERGHLYIYDLKYRKISTFRPCPAVSRCHSFQYWLNF